MAQQYLLLSACTVTFGFLIWFVASTSLRLPQTFQIQYDINTPYVNRFLRRRILMFLLYFVIPWILICYDLAGYSSLNDLGIHFTWNASCTFWILGTVALAVAYGLISGGSTTNLTEYPEIRVTRWKSKLLIISGLTWGLQVFGMEFVFRGLLLQSLRMVLGTDLFAILICTGIYALTHYFKRNRSSFISIPFGLLACFIVIHTESILPVMIIHFINALFSEWLAISRHPEIRVS